MGEITITIEDGLEKEVAIAIIGRAMYIQCNDVDSYCINVWAGPNWPGQYSTNINITTEVRTTPIESITIDNQIIRVDPYLVS